jgi:DNA-binding transcriptional LysR family regulator
MKNISDLNFFLALARQGSMSAAGKLLNVQHTTVSRRIAALEKVLKQKLFHYGNQRYVLTAAGEKLLPHAIKIEEQSLEAQRAILGAETQVAGPLKVTMPYDFFCRVVASEIPRFAETYPDIELEFLCSPSLLDLSSLEADIALRITGNPPGNLIGRKIIALSHGIYGSPRFLRDNTRQPQLILWRGDPPLPPWAMEHFPDANIVARTDEAETMLAMVKNHLGLARIPDYLALGEPTIERLDVPLTPSKWGIWILHHKDLRDTQRVRVFKDFLTDVVIRTLGP